MEPRGAPLAHGARRSRAGAYAYTVFAVVVGLALTWMVSKTVARRAAEQGAAVSTADVVVAREPMPTGATVRADLVEVRKVPDHAVPEGAIADPAVAADRVVRFSLARGEILTDARLTPLGAGSDSSALVPPDLRAVTVRVNDSIASAKLIRPGMFVDVIVAAPPIDQERGAIARMFLQKVRVLAVGDKLGTAPRKTGVSDLLGGGGGKESDAVATSVVTLLVTPEEAEMLALANKEGDLQLAVRNVADEGEAAPPGISIRELLDGAGATVATGAPGELSAPEEERSSSSRPSSRRRSPRSSGGVQIIR